MLFPAAVQLERDGVRYRIVTDRRPRYELVIAPTGGGVRQVIPYALVIDGTYQVQDLLE